MLGIRQDDPALFARSLTAPDTTSTRTTTDSSPSKLQLALEYLDLVAKHPVKMKSVVFHVRRILKDELTRFQLMEDCVRCQSAEEVRFRARVC
jgi:hypothetical protein